MADKKLSVKVSDKGGVSLYGLRRFPVTFYRDEWAVIAKAMPGILEFMQAHASELSSKQDSPSTTKEGHTALKT